MQYFYSACIIFNSYTTQTHPKINHASFTFTVCVCVSSICNALAVGFASKPDKSLHKQQALMSIITRSAAFCDCYFMLTGFFNFKSS